MLPLYCTYIVTPLCDATPPTVTTTGTLPLADPAGTVASIRQRFDVWISCEPNSHYRT
jgi:hypothetical protein